MMIGGGNAVFIDTNILVYANVPETPLHQVALQAIESRYYAGLELWISRQVLREFLATVTRPQNFANPPPLAQMIADVQRFQQFFKIAEDSAAITMQLLALLQQIPMGGKQIHDANIVATMLARGITHLLTHNTADFTRFGQFITVVPL